MNESGCARNYKCFDLENTPVSLADFGVEEDEGEDFFGMHDPEAPLDPFELTDDIDRELTGLTEVPKPLAYVPQAGMTYTADSGLLLATLVAALSGRGANSEGKDEAK